MKERKERRRGKKKGKKERKQERKKERKKRKEKKQNKEERNKKGEKKKEMKDIVTKKEWYCFRRHVKTACKNFVPQKANAWVIPAFGELLPLETAQIIKLSLMQFGLILECSKLRPESTLATEFCPVL